MMLFFVVKTSLPFHWQEGLSHRQAAGGEPAWFFQ
jgi:hypothetical protein